VEPTCHEEVIKELKSQWKILWRDRVDDKVRAEGIANREYSMLFVEKGTVIFATRDFKPLNLKDIVELHKLGDANRIIPPSPTIGGWGKFVRTSIISQKLSRKTKRAEQYVTSEKKRQQLKKGGRGWVHI
jgi:hypothetical protein